MDFFNHSKTADAFTSLKEGYAFLKNEKYVDDEGIIDFEKYQKDIGVIRDRFFGFDYVSNELSTTLKRIVYYDLCEELNDRRFYTMADGEKIEVRSDDEDISMHLHKLDESDMEKKINTNNKYVNIMLDYATKRGWSKKVRDRLRNTFKSRPDFIAEKEGEAVGHFVNISKIEKFLCFDAYVFGLSFEEVKLICESVFDNKTSSSLLGFFSYKMIEKHSINKDEKDKNGECHYYNVQKFIESDKLNCLIKELEKKIKNIILESFAYADFKERDPLIRLDIFGLYERINISHFSNIIESRIKKITEISDSVCSEIADYGFEYADLQTIKNVVNEYVKEAVSERIRTFDYVTSIDRLNGDVQYTKQNVNKVLLYEQGFLDNVLKGNSSISRSHILNLFYFAFMNSNSIYDDEEFLYREEKVGFGSSEGSIPSVLADFITDSNDVLKAFGYGEFSLKRFADMIMALSFFIPDHIDYYVTIIQKFNEVSIEV